MPTTVASNDFTYLFSTAVSATNLKTTPGRIGRLVIYSVGNGGSVNIYDATSGTDNQLYAWVTADGKASIELDARFTTGLRIEVAGTTTAPKGFITYS